jgi:broad specificity phosphatase PhoE
MAELAQNQHDSTPDLAQANVNRATGGAEFSGTGPALEAYARSIANSVYTWQSSGAGDSDAFAGGDGAAYASALTETNRAFVQALGDVEAQRVRADAVEVKAYELQYNAARRVRDDAVSAARRAFAESQAESLFDHVASDPRFMEPVAGSWEGELTGSVSTPWHAHFARLAEAEYELVIGRAPGESLEPWEQSDGQAARTELFEQAVHAQQKTYADTVAGARQTYAGSRIDELIGERVDAVADVPAVAGEWPAPALLALPSGPWEPAAIDVALFDGDSLWSGLDWTQQGYASEFSLRHGEFLQSASGEFRDEYGSSLGFYDLSTRSIGDRSLSYDPNDPASVLGSVTDQASWSGQTWTGPSAWGGADSAWSGPDSSWWTFSTDDLPGLFSTLTTAGTSLDSTTLTGTGSASAGTYDTEGYDAITADGTTGDGSADGSTSAGSGGPSDGSSSTGTTTVGAPLEGTDQLSSELGGEGTQYQFDSAPRVDYSNPIAVLERASGITQFQPTFEGSTASLPIPVHDPDVEMSSPVRFMIVLLDDLEGLSLAEQQETEALFDPETRNRMAALKEEWGLARARLAKEEERLQKAKSYMGRMPQHLKRERIAKAQSEVDRARAAEEAVRKKLEALTGHPWDFVPWPTDDNPLPENTFAYLGDQLYARIPAGLKMAGGAAEIVGGAALMVKGGVVFVFSGATMTPVAVGAEYAGLALIGHGGDNLQAGFRESWTMQETESFTRQALGAAGADEQLKNLIEFQAFGFAEAQVLSPRNATSGLVAPNRGLIRSRMGSVIDDSPRALPDDVESLIRKLYPGDELPKRYLFTGKTGLRILRRPFSFPESWMATANHSLNVLAASIWLKS